MPDVYAMITEVDPDLQEQLATVLELRAADPAQRAMLAEYTAGLDLPDGGAVLEVGCGTGPVCRYLATLPGVASVTGVDPSPLFVERARELAADLTFAVGDGRALDLPATTASTRWSSTRRCATSPTSSARSPRPGACCARAAGSRRSTATTRR